MFKKQTGGPPNVRKMAPPSIEAQSVENRPVRQAMKALEARVVTKSGDADASQMMNKMAETMQKISQKMDNLKKKIQTP